jgi:hypothetical protein
MTPPGRYKTWNPLASIVLSLLGSALNPGTHFVFEEKREML